MSAEEIERIIGYAKNLELDPVNEYAKFGYQENTKIESGEKNTENINLINLSNTETESITLNQISAQINELNLDMGNLT